MQVADSGRGADQASLADSATLHPACAQAPDRAAILARTSIAGASWPSCPSVSVRPIVEIRAAWRMFRLFMLLLKVLVIMRVLGSHMSAVRLAFFKRRWSLQALDVLGVRLQAQAFDLPARALLVSNHISWLDICVISARVQPHFVCKEEIRKWPGVGWFVAATGTIFIARSSRTDAARTAKALAECLQRGERVVFFPEGTTTNGTMLLPFNAALFEAANPSQACVVPMTLRYLDLQGQPSLAAAYDGDVSFIECLRSIVKAPGLLAELKVLPPLPPGLGRREYAAMAREQIANDLGVA